LHRLDVPGTTSLSDGLLALESGDYSTALDLFARARPEDRAAIEQAMLRALGSRRKGELDVPEGAESADVAPAALEKLILLETFLPRSVHTGLLASEALSRSRRRLTGELPGGILARPTDGGAVEADDLAHLAR